AGRPLLWYQTKRSPAQDSPWPSFPHRPGSFLPSWPGDQALLFLRLRTGRKRCCIRASLLQRGIDLLKDLPGLQPVLTGEALDCKPHVHKHELSDLDIHEIEPDFLFEVTIVHDPDIPVLDLQHFCRNCNAHRWLTPVSGYVLWIFPTHKNSDKTLLDSTEYLRVVAVRLGRREINRKCVLNLTPGKRFELLRCRAPVAFKATALPD